MMVSVRYLGVPAYVDVERFDRAEYGDALRVLQADCRAHAQQVPLLREAAEEQGRSGVEQLVVLVHQKVHDDGPRVGDLLGEVEAVPLGADEQPIHLPLKIVGGGPARSACVELLLEREQVYMRRGGVGLASEQQLALHLSRERGERGLGVLLGALGLEAQRVELPDALLEDVHEARQPVGQLQVVHPLQDVAHLRLDLDE
jgi:hypothetical protein